MITGRNLLRGATWIYASQIVTVLLQFAYAAVTSRSVTSAGFGAYAIALSATAIVSLLATGGLGQSVTRMQTLERVSVQRLTTMALSLGLLSGLVLFLFAPFLASIWGVPSATQGIRLLSITGFIGPLAGLATGVLTRLGKFRHIATITIFGNAIGMCAGVLSVLKWHSASALLAYAIAAQIFVFASTLFLTREYTLGLQPFRELRGHLAFNSRLTLANALYYLTSNISLIGMSHSVTTHVLGQYNRANVLTIVPFWQLQTSITRVTYAEFRHDIGDSTRAFKAWTDMFIIVSWVCFPLGGIGAVLVPRLLPVLFGSGWQQAAQLSTPLVLAGALSVLAVMLSSAIESLGRFRWVWQTEALLMIVQAVAAWGVIATNSPFVVAYMMIVVALVRHGWQIWLVGKVSYLNVPRLLKGYATAAVYSLTLSLQITLVLHFLDEDNLFGSLIAVTTLTALIIFTFRKRAKFPPFLLVHEYGLVRKKTRTVGD